MAEIHRHGLIRSNAGILESAKYSDMSVRCGSQEFKLHRAIVCPRSTFFAAACDGQFQEAQTGTIVLKEDDPPTVSRMLTYLYTLTYDDEGDAASAEHYMVDGTKVLEAATTPNTPPPEEELSRHAKMMNNVVVYAIAQKYDISELKELAKSKFRELLWLNAPGPGLPHVVDTVFETTSIADSGLRNVVANYCTKFSTKIVADDHLSTMIKEHGDLGLDVLRQYQAEKQKALATMEGHFAVIMVEWSNLPTMRGYEHNMSSLQKHLQIVHDLMLK